MINELGNSTQIIYGSIRVVNEEIIYLVMDNARDNKTNESMLEYSEYMAANYNIVVQHQVPRSPETNMLDIGACMTVQYKVEIYRRLNVKQHDSLKRSVNKGWRNVE